MIVAVMLAIALVLVGLAGAAWGVSTALRAPRPANLAGAAIGAVGLALTLLGATALAVPGFLL